MRIGYITITREMAQMAHLIEIIHIFCIQNKCDIFHRHHSIHSQSNNFLTFDSVFLFLLLFLIIDEHRQANYTYIISNNHSLYVFESDSIGIHNTLIIVFIKKQFEWINQTNDYLYQKKGIISLFWKISSGIIEFYRKPSIRKALKSKKIYFLAMWYSIE